MLVVVACWLLTMPTYADVFLRGLLMTMRETGKGTEILETWALVVQRKLGLSAHLSEIIMFHLKKKNAMYYFIYILRLFVIIVANL